MGKGKRTGMRHYAKTSWWSGRARALCGITWDAGEWEDSSWFSTDPICPTCKRLRKEGKRR